MPRISRYNSDTKRIEWVDASQDEYEAWKAARAAKVNAKKGAGRNSSRPHRAAPASETLDESGPHPDPSGPKRKGGPNTKPESVLAPALPRLAQALAMLVYRTSHTVTRGRAPMSAKEAGYVAIPAVRILDRTAAKYVKSTGVVTPNQEDTALIVVTVAMWLLGWVMAVLTRQPGTAPAMPAQGQQMPADLFSGSEPSGPGSAPSPAPAPTRQPQAQPSTAVADEGDLFSGSEPLAADGSAPVQTATARQVDPRAAAVSEAVWAAISPTDRGEALAG